MSIQSKVLRGQRKVQGIWGEALILGPLLPTPAAPVTALLSRETATQKFVEGKGLEEVVTMNASVVLSDLSAAPYIGQPAQARGRSWRVFNVNPTPTTYEITLESPKK